MHSEDMNGKKNLIIAFHSYPTKPCVDGLMATIITTRYSDCKIKLVPYWRTAQSFQRLKRTVESCDKTNTSILYLDCAPDLDEEVDYLLSIVDDVPVMVYDHHPKQKDTPMQKLQEKGVNFKCKIDEKLCGAKMVYHYLLKEKEQAELKVYHELLHLVHFSDYEGVNDALSGKAKATEIAKVAFEKAIAASPNGNTRTNLRNISKTGMALYYILDNIMALPAEWKFLYGNGSDDDICEQFITQQAVYLKHALHTVSGQHCTVYGEEATGHYIQLMRDLDKKILTGIVLREKQIGEKIANVFVCNIDIFLYGRSLEPRVQSAMKKVGATYAVLMNNPTKNKEGEDSYYFSLRRDNEGTYDARDLATYLKEVTGTKIGGGHPWASGISLNSQQYRQFYEQLMS